MQPAPGRLRWRRWLRWGRVLVLGLALGGVQVFLLLFAANPLLQWSTTWWPFVALSAFFYLGIPALEGFLTAWPNEEAFLGVGTGCLVGGISFLAIAIPAFSISVQALNAPRPACPSDCPRFYLPPSFGIAVVVVPAVMVAGMSGVVGGLLGGWIGGVLGERRARRSNQGSAIAARELPSEEAPGTEALPG